MIHGTYSKSHTLQVNLQCGSPAAAHVQYCSTIAVCRHTQYINGPLQRGKFMVYQNHDQATPEAALGVRAYITYFISIDLTYHNRAGRSVINV
jgi:hypothetical protein